jgi:hypothetical protein
MKSSVKSPQPNRNEKGQAIALMVIVLAALVAIVALAVDGGRLYYEQRTAQNAADNASLAGALALCERANVNTAAFGSAVTNGFNNNGTTNSVTVNNPPGQGPNAGDIEYVEVIVNSVRQSSFAQVVYTGALESTVRAVASCDLQLAFEHAIFGGSETCNNTVTWASSNVTINGGVHTNKDIKMTGTNNFINGDVTVVTSVDGTDGNVTYNPAPPDNPLPGEVEPYPVPYEMVDYAPGGASALIADAAGEYHYCDCDMNMAWFIGEGLFVGNDLADGLYYATGDIDLTNNVISAPNVTLVAEGSINVNGSNQNIGHYIDGLLLFTDLDRPGASACSVAAISMSGSTNDWNGVIFAPNGLVTISGASATTFSGSIFSASVSLSGSNLFIETDQGLLPPPPPELNLAE